MKSSTSVEVVREVVVLPTATGKPGRPIRRQVTVSNQCPAWDRQPGESIESARILSVYIGMGHTRSLEKLAAKIGKSYGATRAIAARGNFSPRLRAWQAANSDEYQQRAAERRNDAADEHVDEMADLRRTTASTFTPEEIAGMHPRERVAFYLGLAKHEMMVHGITERGAAAGTTVNVTNAAPADPNGSEATAVAMAVLSWAATAEISPAARQSLAIALASLGGGTDPRVIAGQLG